MAGHYKRVLLQTSLIFVLLSMALNASAQKVAVKTNVLYWATATPNIGFEFALSKKRTLNISGGYNAWQFGSDEKNKKLSHFSVQPELRLWRCQAFNRGYWGFHTMGGIYNLSGIKAPLDIISKLDKYRYEGWFVGAGVSYGHQWYLGPHWNLEATFGFGYAYIDYKKYDCAKCGAQLSDGAKHYFGPTKLGLSFVYLFKYKNKKR